MIGSTNVLKAVINISKNPLTDIISYYRGKNRINNVGEALEIYIKDVFSSCQPSDSISEKLEKYKQYFSYLGNQNNPPDILIRSGDAIEVKKIESEKSGIALNSSYPKDKLYASNPMITTACRSSEDWQVKDILYIIGTLKDNQLKSLWMVYGDCLAANKEIYERISQRIAKGILELSDVEFAPTKEIGRVNKVDPLGITNLRIRGMWHIANPSSVYEYLPVFDKSDGDFVVNVLMLQSKYLSFPPEDRKLLEASLNSNLRLLDVKIKSPNNPADLLNAELISFKL